MADIKKISISIIGGDNRQRELLNILDKESDDGYEIKAYGITPFKSLRNIKYYDKLNNEFFSSDIVLLPIPYKDKSGYIPLEDFNERITAGELLEYCHPKSNIVLGKKDWEIENIANRKGLNIVDLLELEEFAVLNAIPSAEGAIQIALQQRNSVIHKTQCIVLGYGRIGKILAHMLKGLGASVSVEARKNVDLCWIEAMGYNAIHIKDLGEKINNFDIIFNTVPALILDKKILNNVRKDSLIIDLASYPGGTDFEAAKELGLRAVLALGLPGKLFPKTAANAIWKTLKILLIP